MYLDSTRPVLTVTLLFGLGACSVFSPTPPAYHSIESIRPELDSSSTQAAPVPDYVSAQEWLIFYLPNRLLDVIDLLKVSVGVGPGFGLELYASENFWLSYLNYRSWRLGIDGRSTGLYEEGRYREWHLGDRRGDADAKGRALIGVLGPMRAYEAPLRDGVPALPPVPKNAWDIGVQAHALIAGAEVLIRPYELFDFVVGLWGDDPAGDDFGMRRYPLHEYSPQSDVVEIFINAIDQMHRDDLRATLASDLRKRAWVRQGGSLAPLEAGGEAGAAPDSGVGSKDFLLVGDVRIEPHRYRDSDGANLDFAVRCTETDLRWGVPAEFRYSLSFYNRFIRTTDEFELTLRVEHKHWVITRIRRIDPLEHDRNR